MNANEGKYLIVAALRVCVGETRRATMLWTMQTLISIFEDEYYYFKDIMLALAEHAAYERDRSTSPDEEDQHSAWENIEVLLRAAAEQAEDL